MTLCDAPGCATPESQRNTAIDLPEGVPPLRLLYLYLTSCCNLRCRHCWISPVYEGEYLKPGTYIDFDALKAGVREAKELGLCGAKLTGGEPLLHPRFLDIVAFLSSEDIALSMETNGTLITPEIARYLKNESTLHHISVSLDSPEASGHDAFRGVPGSFARALNGLDALVDAGFTNCQVIMSLHRKNRQQVADLVQLAIAHGAASVKFNPINRTGRGIGMHERGEILDFLELMELANHIFRDLIPASTVPLYVHLPPALLPLSELRKNGGSCGTCGVATILGILGGGEIALCGIGQTIPELVYGQLGRDSIRDIWLNNPVLKDLRESLKDVAGYPGICGSCIHAKSCRTGCVANNYMENGVLVSPQTCCLEAEKHGIFPKTRLR